MLLETNFLLRPCHAYTADNGRSNVPDRQMSLGRLWERCQRRVSEKQYKANSYSEDRSILQVNECAFDSGLIEKYLVQMLTWISLEWILYNWIIGY